MLTLEKQHELNTLKEKMQAREEERDRIGREMHDDIGSALTTILYLSEDLKIKNKQPDPNIAEKISSTATGIVAKMNDIIWSMNRQYDTIDDLIAYTRQQAVEFLQNHSLKYHFNMPDSIPDIHISGEQRRNIYLVIKESLHNIVKHSCASEVDIFFQINEEFICLSTYADAEIALKELPDLKPDIALMDINLPGMSGIECIKEIKKKYSQIQFMMFTIYENSEQVYEALAAGASGYLLKKTPPEEILHGMTWYNPDWKCKINCVK